MLTLLYIVIGICVLYCGYFVVTALGFFKKSNVTNVKSDKKNNFAILIAARNEEAVIGNLIASLKKQNYPKECFDIYVIPNNCTDNTSEVSKKAGANIIECKVNVKTKGDVLNYTFDKLSSKKDIDAYVIFDADNLVDSNFLSEMNDTINRGYEVAQGFRDSKNISENYLTTSYAITWYIENLFVFESRHKLGKSCYLNGTGIMIKKEIIDKYGFRFKTITEDAELVSLCALNDIKIAFVKDAVFYDEQVSKLGVSMVQRKRWSLGAKQCFKEYYSLLIKKGIKNKSFECMDILLFYMAFAMQAFFSLALVILFIYNLVTISNFFVIGLVSLIVTYFICVLFRIIVLKLCNKSIRDNIWGILLFDIFVLSWIPVNFICLFINNCNWVQIKHNGNMSGV